MALFAHCNRDFSQSKHHTKLVPSFRVFRCPLRSTNGSTRAYRPIVAAVVVTRPSRSTPQEKTALGLACRCVLGGMRINYGKFHQTRTARLAQMHSLPAMSAGDLVILLRAVRDYFNLAFWARVCMSVRYYAQSCVVFIYASDITNHVHTEHV